MDYLISKTNLHIGIIAFFLSGMIVGFYFNTKPPKTFEEQRQERYLNCVSKASVNNYPELLKACKNILTK